MDINQLRQKSKALGFSFECGLNKGAGYVLVDGNDDRPLGHDYTASLADIESYLDNFAGDLGVEVEISDDKECKPPPTPAELRKSLLEYANADQIKSVLSPPSSTQQEQRDRIALDRLMAVGTTTHSAKAFEQLPEAEKQKHHANLRAALAKEEKAKAAKLPKSTLPLRLIGLNPDHPVALEKARQGREFQKANQQLRTNIASLKDSPEAVQEERDRLKNSLPPAPGAYDPAPKPPSEMVVTVIERRHRVSKADRQRAPRLARLRADILAAIARDDRAAAGSLLKEAKRVLGHGSFGTFVTEEIAISPSSAQRYIKEALG